MNALTPSSDRKVVLNPSSNIPFNKLVLSQSNVRRTKAGVSIEDLAEDIARRGLLQSLSVRPVLNADGQETGMFSVPAGGRRFRALELLIKQKRLAKSAVIPVIVKTADAETSAEEDSLAENVQRIGLHPLDQFRAFLALSQQGATDEEIAARFFVSAAIVKQRLRLTTVSPVLLEAYADEAMTLEQLMAFSVSSDHVRQEELWQSVKGNFSAQPYHIRRLLTETSVEATDRRAVFIGLEAYQQAGGVIMRDLFQADDGGWLQDIALLERLVNEKLSLAAEAMRAEGWLWVEAAQQFPYGHTNGLRRLISLGSDLDEAESEARAAAISEYDDLQETFADAEELSDEADTRLGELEAIIEAFDNRPARYDPEEVGRAGAFVSLGNDGALKLERGFVRAEDEAPEAENEPKEGEGAHDEDKSEPGRPTIHAGAEPTLEDDDDNAVRPLPERLIIELSAYRTLALRNALACNPRVALTALLYQLVSFRVFRQAGGCLDAFVRQASFAFQADDLKDSPPAVQMTERNEAWDDVLPDEDQALWDWLHVQSDDMRSALLAHLIGFGVNALYERANPYGGGVSERGLRMRFDQADRLTRALDLDLAETGWVPTVANYLGRVTKAHILQAVREACGDRDVLLIEHLKKAAMAKEAERLLKGTGWLPEALRTSELGEVAASQPDEVPALPAFLEDEVVTRDDDHAAEASSAAAE